MDQSQKKLEQYEQNWLDHVRKMKDIRHPEQIDSRADGRQDTWTTFKDGCNRKAEVSRIF
jgi:hypothetical protein